MKKELLLILDFGAQNNRKVAEIACAANVYCEALPYSSKIDEILKKEPKGIVFIGEDEVQSMETVNKEARLMTLRIPVLTLGNQRTEDEIKGYLFDVCKFSGDFKA